MNLGLERKINEKWQNLKGSKKDPFLYLGMAAVILIACISFATPSRRINSPIFIESPQNKNQVFLAAEMKIKESPDLSLIQKNSLVAVSPPIMVTPQILGALLGGSDYEWTQKEVTEYIVEPGDNLWSIAEKFNISLDTLLWVNDLNKNSLLQIGQKLVVLPVSGVIHHVQKGDTLSEIAKTYKADASEVAAFNDLTGDKIYIGDILIIPGGIMPPPPVRYASASVPLGDSYFMCPHLACHITQGLHWYNAIDFGGKCGEPVFAAAAGTVLKVKLTNSASKWAFGGAGNHLTILHPNGVVTFYGHLQTALVNPGDYVSRGQMIATIGGALGMPGSGNSTGCHLHFGVNGARNPFAR